MHNLDHLRMLVTAADAGSFSACARALGRAQSAVSQGIANLEIDLDLTLFDRATRKPTLTADGARMVTMARAVLQQADAMQVAAEAVHQGDEAQIRLAMDDAVLLPSLGPILRKFSEHFPATRLELVTLASPDVSPMITAGNVDIGVFFTPIAFDDTTDVCFIGTLPCVAVCAPDHPLAQIKSPTPTDMVLHRQILLRGLGGGSVELLNQIAAQAWWANSFQAIQHLCEQGLGWSYLPQHRAQKATASGRLHQLNVSFDHKPWSPPVELVTRKFTPMGPAQSWLFERLKTLL